MFPGFMLGVGLKRYTSLFNGLSPFRVGFGISVGGATAEVVLMQDTSQTFNRIWNVSPLNS